MKRKLGYSLTEVLVSIVILGILMTSMEFLFVNTRKAVVKTLAKKEAENHISETMNCFCSAVYSTNDKKELFLKTLMNATKVGNTSTYQVGYDSSFEEKKDTIQSGNYLEYTYSETSSTGEVTYSKYVIQIVVYFKNEIYSSLSTERTILVDI